MIILASDHAGFAMKEAIKAYLLEKGYHWEDVGCCSEEPCDYSDFGHALAKKVLAKKDLIGIAICGTGIGMSMVINRHCGVRAARCCSNEDAELTRKHNDANVVVLGGRQIKLEDAISMLEIFLKTPFEGGRHQRRIEKIDQMG